MELLKTLMIKISEAYDKLFKTWTRFVIFFAAYFLAVNVLPNRISTIIALALLAFIIIAILGRELRRKGPKS